jgi:hypothetical protein
MSDTVIVTAIIAAAILGALFIFRKRLTKFLIRFKGIDAQLTAAPLTKATNTSKGLSVSGNKQVGMRNIIDIQKTQGDVSDNTQKGADNQLRVDSSPDY